MFIWCKHSAADVRTNTRMGENDSAALVLDTTRRMKVSAQICLRWVEGGFTVHDVKLGALPAGVTASWYHVENVVYNDGVPYPDKLSSQKSVDVKNNVTHVIWVLFDVRETAEAGLYRIPVTVKTSLSEEKAHVTLHVHPVTLPAATEKDAFGHEYFLNPFGIFAKEGKLKNPPCEPFYDYPRYSPAWWDFMTEMAKTLRTLRVNSLNVEIMTLLIDAGSKKLPEGGWDLKYDLLDAFVSHFLTHGAFRYITIGAIIASVDGKTIRAIDENGNGCWYEIGTPEADAWAEAFYISGVSPQCPARRGLRRFFPAREQA